MSLKSDQLELGFSIYQVVIETKTLFLQIIIQVPIPTFSKYHRQYYGLISKFQVELKSLLR